MEKTTIDILFNALRACEALACIAGLYYWYKVKGTYLKWLPIYFVFILIAEIIGSYFRMHDMRSASNIFYNYIVIPIEFLFFIWIFYRENKNKKTKWLPITCGIVYIGSWVLDRFYLSTQSFWFYSFSYTVGNLLLLILILQFFIKLITSNEILFFKNNLLFWVSAGLLIFYLGSFPYYGLRNTLIKYHSDLCTTYSYIVFILDSVMYLVFAIGFIVSRSRKNEAVNGSDRV